MPAVPGLDQVDHLTNSSMMNVGFLPDHLLILGGSYIGLEFAQMYRPCSFEKCLRTRKEGHDIVMAVDCDGTSEICGSHLLIATGRRPNTDDLGLEHADVKRDARGYIIVDDELRANAPGIWALGDCNGRGAFAHTCWNVMRSSPPICSMVRIGG